jgi:two-component system, NarL family, sensor histidine kinase DegS
MTNEPRSEVDGMGTTAPVAVSEARPEERFAGNESDQEDALLAEARAAVGAGANALRDVRERYREVATRTGPARDDRDDRESRARDDRDDRDDRESRAVRATGALNRLDLAVRSLENAWLFLDRDDTSLITDPSAPLSLADVQMRIVQAQESERSRLAREVHDGPAQALANAIFQAEVVQRAMDRDPHQGREELRQLRELLSRELRGVRAYLSQLRPPLLADLGLSGAIQEAADQTGDALGVDVSVEIDEQAEELPETIEIVILRVVQEALQNARKHASPTAIRVRVVRASPDDGDGWLIEVRDDGRGFDAAASPIRGRRNFGLQFMRERADLIGARFEVRSTTDLGTTVRMTIPPASVGSPIPVEEAR